ncbi:Crp/Fnr family transcriptional regulator [Aureimonas sp. Leaf454]|uniref:Crp/Fnr family transcriptional regulator n=1 Tax=Aureimonas sp. Leaf454 TaxID=1736381 RepID=UPI0006FD5A9A|nr:Crp/Fnr family transcriptional regulator [Aureimonas sp. Leaf454]KQT50946.1 Crp/Fnr family transcriptional regulator [Aureimonas sp. Leaf454]
MSRVTPLTFRPVILRLKSIIDLSPDDEAAFEQLPMVIRDFPADQDVVRDGDRPHQCCMVLSGLTCRYKVIADGRRQILAFNIPGDLPDLQSLHLDIMDHSVATVVPSRLGFVPHAAMRELSERRPGITAALWRETLIDGATFRAKITGIGRMSARARVAHLFCELLLRLDVVGLADGFRYKLPLTQTELGDALGLSVVHVNRILQDLRTDNIIAVERRTVTILNWEQLKSVGQFDPTYLQLRAKPSVEIFRSG